MMIGQWVKVANTVRRDGLVALAEGANVQIVDYLDGWYGVRSDAGAAIVWIQRGDWS
jgi:hypothetical protein